MVVFCAVNNEFLCTAALRMEHGLRHKYVARRISGI